MNTIELRNATIEICAVCGELSYIIAVYDEFCTNPLCPVNLDEEDFIEAFVNNLLAEEIDEYEGLLNEENTGDFVPDKQPSMHDFQEEDSED